MTKPDRVDVPALKTMADPVTQLDLTASGRPIVLIRDRPQLGRIQPISLLTLVRERPWANVASLR